MAENLDVLMDSNVDDLDSLDPGQGPKQISIFSNIILFALSENLVMWLKHCALVFKTL